MAAPRDPRKRVRRPRKISRYTLRPVRSLSLRRRVVDVIASDQAKAAEAGGKRKPSTVYLVWLHKPELELSPAEKALLDSKGWVR
jgi:hypothetical protein